MAKKRLSLEDVIRKSWQVYKKNLGHLLLVVILGILLVGVFLVPGMIAMFVGLAGCGSAGACNTFSIAGIVILIITVMLASLASLIYSVALIKAVGDAEGGSKIETKKVFSLAYQKFWLVLGTSILAAVFIFLGLILLVIPGLVLAIYFQFIMYVVIFENKWGMDAIKRSMEIVKGNFWWVVLIILLIVITQGFLGWIPFVGSILAFILTPLWQIIMYVVYKDLRGLKGADEQK